MIRALMFALAMGFPGTARACEVALVLAMDVSGSVDPAEYRLQIDGLASALQDQAVREILVQENAALLVTQWSNVGQQRVTLPWTRIRTARDVEGFAEAVRLVPRAYAGSDTAVGAALFHALDQLALVPDCRRKIVDLSGDGDENVGFTVGRARQAAIAQGVEVNALAIESMGVSISNFYRRWVITPGGFVETSRGHLDYARAIRSKLLRELTKPAS
jgi:Ca-activated chloride channel family protein